MERRRGKSQTRNVYARRTSQLPSWYAAQRGHMRTGSWGSVQPSPPFGVYGQLRNRTMTDCTHKYHTLTDDTAYCPACGEQFTARDLVEVVRELQATIDEMDADMELPEIRKLGKARLKVKKISRLQPPLPDSQLCPSCGFETCICGYIAQQENTQ